jgi:AAA15 family ATPase/GTPase
MINSISLENFKAFGHEQKIPIKPITLIFGANSSGKSSIIHSLLLTHEALLKKDNKAGNYEINYTTIGGDSVDLGGFRQYVYKGKADTVTTLKYEFDLRGGLFDHFVSLDGINNLTLVFEIGQMATLMANINDDLDMIKLVEENTSPHKKTAVIKNFQILTDNTLLLKMSARYGFILQMEYINPENDYIKSLLKGIISLYTTSEKITPEDEITFKKALSILIPDLKSSLANNFPSSLINFDKKNKNLLEPISSANRDEAIFKAVISHFPYLLSNFLIESYELFRYHFNSLEYLGPLRSYPDRHFLFQNKINDNNWIAGGGAAWEKLVKHEKLRVEINKWFDNDKLKSKYRFELIDYLPENIINKNFSKIFENIEYRTLIELFLRTNVDPDLMNPEHTLNYHEFAEKLKEELDEGFLNSYQDEFNPEFKSEAIEELKSYISDEAIQKAFYKEFIKEILKDKKDKTSDLVLIDKNSDTIVTHRDVGIGISQVLPVLVSAFGNVFNMIAIEQPEIHLHPSLQAELGDVFINSALGENKNTFILETHSEHLILRIMRRIRETTNGTLSGDVKPIKPEDVSILFVDPTEKGSMIIEMPINNQGELIKGWPGGFFEERLNEII